MGNLFPELLEEKLLEVMEKDNAASGQQFPVTVTYCIIL